MRMKVSLNDIGWTNANVVRVWFEINGKRVLLSLSDDFVQIDRFKEGNVHTLEVSETQATEDFLEGAMDTGFDVAQGIIPMGK